MNLIIERFLIPLFFVMSIVYVFNSFSREAIELTKVRHHVGSDSFYVENGRISFLFSGQPDVQEIKTNDSKGDNDQLTYQTFFFPGVCIKTKECNDMIQSACGRNVPYSIKIEEGSNLEKGLMVTFGIPTNKVAISYDMFDSIGLQSGIVFRLYNKDVIDQLMVKSNQPVVKLLNLSSRPCIIVDPGHGGFDSGAIGYDDIQEKNICLAVGTMVADMLERQGCSVVLTRKDDHYLFLDERTACAHKHYADLLVSIHANYAANKNASGIETFCMKPTLFKKSYSDLSHNQKDYCLKKVHNTCNSSYMYAQSVQSNLCKLIKDSGFDVIDRKVKFSLMQVLLGSQMPSILVEVGFISHAKEAQLLADDDYQKIIAQGIVNGIIAALPDYL